MRPGSGGVNEAVSDRIPILCLGSGAALSSGRQYGCLLIDKAVLLDIGPSAVPQLHRLGIDPTGIDHIFISHLHADHMFGLPFLLLEYCVRYEREEPLYIIGPPGLESMVEQLCSLAWPDMREKGFHPHVPLVFTEIDREGTYRTGEMEVAAVPMEHFGLQAFGYRFTRRGLTFGYTGDTGPGPQIPRLLRGVDVAILELTHASASDDPGHLDLHDVAGLAKQLTAQGTTVMANHIGETPDPIDGVTLCEDGKLYYV